jgi:capsular polysaccharide biosynthesis protein
MKKLYEVEFRRTSYITITVQASDKQDAEDIAWELLDDTEEGDADWNVESVEEVKGDDE